MMALKCKMCGGTLEFKSGDTVATCDSCGTLQTLPKMDDEHRMNLYDRANHYRRANEFDKAMGIYEQILNEDRTDAESYWSLVLCRYGIEYVEDPNSHKRVPTVNRAQYTSIYDDEDYKSALQYATVEQKKVYEQEAEKINEIQKGILAISQKEEPFDVFICYKETDSNGRRTQDSVLANDLYHQLTQEGFKVFFSRITLEDKLGTAYEPYIFAALNSAKVMVVLGTKEEYFNAVWVKNEWSRFLALIRDGKRKILIPAYRDMDPYDLPEEFSHLQAQDMSKLGFMQDLIRGIKKLVGVEKKQQVELEDEPSGNVQNDIDPLLIRTAMFLEDENWEKADEYAERILDMNPKCAQAYLDKMMAELHVSKIEKLVELKENFEKNMYYIKFLQHANEKSARQVKLYLFELKNRLTYEEAISALNHANNISEYDFAKNKFNTIIEYKDAKIQVERCKKKKEELIENTLNDLVFEMKNAQERWQFKNILDELHKLECYKDVSAYCEECENMIVYLGAVALSNFKNESSLNQAKEQFLSLDGFRDSNQKAVEIEYRIDKIKKNRHIKKIILVSFSFLCVITVVFSIFYYMNTDGYKLEKAKEYMKENKYSIAIEYLKKISDRKEYNADIEKMGDACFNAQDYDMAGEMYRLVDKKNNLLTEKAEQQIEKYNYKKALKYYVMAKDSKNIKKTAWQLALKYMENRDYDKALSVCTQYGDEKMQHNVKKSKAGYYYIQKEYDKAITLFEEIGEDKLADKVKEAKESN